MKDEIRLGEKATRKSKKKRNHTNIRHILYTYSYLLCIYSKIYFLHTRTSNVTRSEKTDHMEIFAQIELLVPSECAFHCTSIGAINAVIGASVAKL